MTLSDAISLVERTILFEQEPTHEETAALRMVIDAARELLAILSASDSPRR